MRNILSVLLIGIILGSAGLHVGKALFSDRSISEGNMISTGEFDVKISKSGERFYNDLKLFEFENLKPGDSRDLEFHIKNYGDTDISKLTLSFKVEDLEDGTLTTAESLVDNTTDVGELSQNIIITKFEVTKNGQTYSLSNYINKTLKEISDKEISLLNNAMSPSEEVKVAIGFKLSSSAGNECQTDIAKVSLEIYAEQ